MFENLGGALEKCESDGDNLQKRGTG